MQKQPSSFPRFVLDVAANEGISFGAGALGALIVYVFTDKNTTNRWTKISTVYTATSLAATGVRLLFQNNSKNNI